MNAVARIVIVLLFIWLIPCDIAAQTFPNPASLSTGQGTPGTLDPIWTVSDNYPTLPPNPIGLTYTPALINNNCAPGAWVDPASLPPPVNNGNWITNPATPCATNITDGYFYFRLELNLPADCNGNGVTTVGSYVLNFAGYVDNTITDVFVNGTSMGISGGAFAAGTQLNFTLPGPWAPGINFIDILVYNFPNAGNANPYGLLMVPNSQAPVLDSDGDGVPDIDDLCLCVAGNNPNGCPPLIAGDTIICWGETTSLRTFLSGDYLWSTGATIDSIIVSPTVNTVYSLTVTELSGTVHTGSINVIVNPLPTATITPAVAEICLGEGITLTASGGVSYAWGGGQTSAAITVSPATSTPYTVTVTDANGCTATATRNVTVNPLPTATITPATAAICLGESITLTASGGTNYAWGGGQNTAAITVSPATSTPYTVNVTDANGCTATATRNVTVNPLPTATITPATAAICLGEGITLTASGGVSYTWGGGQNTAAITVSPATSTPFTVNVTDANGCTATATRNVTVNPLPTATITPATAAICLGEGITLTASGGVSYAWGGGQATAAIAVSPATSTPFTVTVTDANGCTATATRNVTVNPLPTATITPATAAICLGESITLTASGGASYAWGGGQTTAAITVSPATSTPFTVTVTDANGCTATSIRNVTVNPLNTRTDSPSICNGELYTLPDGTTVNTAGTYTSTVSGPQCDTVITTQLTVFNINTTNIVATTCANQPYTRPNGAVVIVSGTYIDTLINQWGCDSIITTSLTVTPLPQLTVYDTICAYQTYTLPSGIQVSTAGLYLDTVLTHGVCDTLFTIYLEVIDVNLSTTATNLRCNGDNSGTIACTVTGALAPTSFQWSEPGFAGDAISACGAGIFGVTGTDAFGCSATDVVTITEPPVLEVATTVVHTSCFEKTDGRIAVTPQGGTMGYSLTLNGDAVLDGQLDDLAAGIYEVMLTDANGCVVAETVTITEPDAFVLYTQPDTLLMELGDTLEIEVSSNYEPSTSYAWDYLGLSCQNCANPVLALHDTDTLRLTTTYASPNQNVNCLSNFSLPVIVKENKNLFIPTAFSPNNDGQNDEYRIYGNLKGLRVFNIKIYDRLGEKIFESDSPYFVWQGGFKGTLVQGGVYIYVVRYAWHSSWEKMNTQQGSLTILR